MPDLIICSHCRAPSTHRFEGQFPVCDKPECQRAVPCCAPGPTGPPGSSIVTRPWGTYEVLYDGPDCKVKKITVNAGQRLSLQSHKLRGEMWSIISGVGFVEVHRNCTDELDKGYVFVGDVISIERYEKHRIKNPSGPDSPWKDSFPLVFIETQVGESFDENDIKRYEDDYGRVPKEGEKDE